MIANHFLECIYVHHCNAKPKIQSSLSTQNPTEGQSQVNTQSNGYNSTSTVQNCMDGLKGIEKMVMDYLHQPSSIAQEKGMHRNEIAQQLKVLLEKILEAIESLEAEGLVYSTIDEFHYKSISA
nr:replication protein A 32 kDa subunit A-like [Ipomoea batatas]